MGLFDKTRTFDGKKYRHHYSGTKRMCQKQAREMRGGWYTRIVPWKHGWSLYVRRRGSLINY